MVIICTRRCPRTPHLKRLSPNAKLSVDFVARHGNYLHQKMPSDAPLEKTLAEREAEDLTNESPIRNSTIEELKSKLESKEIGDCETTAAMIPETHRGAPPHTPSPPLLSDEGLIIPRKPPNPVRENAERQNLHKELLFNQKIGKNVLNQKSELQRALEKQKDNLAKKELENHIAAQAPELEKVIADRARRLQEVSNDTKNEDDKSINKEILQARLKLKATNDVK